MKLFRVLVFVSLLIFGVENQAGAEILTWVDSTPTSEYFVDLENLNYETDIADKPITNIIYFWRQEKITPEAIPRLVKVFGEKTRGTNVILWRMSIHLVDKTSAVHYMLFLTDNGDLLDSYTPLSPIYSIISPNTLNGKEFHIVEQYARSHRNDILRKTMENVEKVNNSRKKGKDKE